MAFYSESHQLGFRVFDESDIARPSKKQEPLEFYKRYSGHKPLSSWPRAPSYGNCGSKMRTKDSCQAMTKCWKCECPYRSDSSRCLTRPIRTGALTIEQLKTYQEAEAEAATAEAPSFRSTTCQVPNPDGGVAVASTQENPTGNARRLWRAIDRFSGLCQ